jgi:uncharacterized protein YoxC
MDNNIEKNLLVFNNYNPQNSFDILLEKLEKIENKINVLEQDLNTKTEALDNKIEKLLQSTKSLIQYFTSKHDRDIREVNYRLRSYASQHTPPINFVPQKGDIIL